MGKVSGTTIKSRADRKLIDFEYDILFRAIRKEMGVGKRQIVSRNKHREVCEARQMFCLLARDLVKDVSVKVGEQINRDHATVLYSAATMRNLCSFDKKLRITKSFIEKEVYDMLDKYKLSVPICEHCKQPIYEERLS
jgi:chromosomal replication initiation ATPase DnaA